MASYEWKYHTFLTEESHCKDLEAKPTWPPPYLFSGVPVCRFLQQFGFFREDSQFSACELCLLTADLLSSNCQSELVVLFSAHFCTCISETDLFKLSTSVARISMCQTGPGRLRALAQT